MRVSRRKERMTSLVRDEVAQFIERHAALPQGAFATVTHVAVNDAESQVKVFLSLFPAEHIGAFMREMHAVESQFNARLKEILRTKKLPVAKFIFDNEWLKIVELENAPKKEEN